MHDNIYQALYLNREELRERMELIPADTQELVKKALADFQSVDKEPLEKIRTDMTGAKYLLIKENEWSMWRVPRLIGGFNDFNLAVACARVMSHPLIGMAFERYNGSAEDFYKKFLEIMDRLHFSEINKNSILYRYGFYDGVYHTLEETGKKYGGVKDTAVHKRIEKSMSKIFNVRRAGDF